MVVFHQEYGTRKPPNLGLKFRPKPKSNNHYAGPIKGCAGVKSKSWQLQPPLGQPGQLLRKSTCEMTDLL